MAGSDFCRIRASRIFRDYFRASPDMVPHPRANSAQPGLAFKIGLY